MATLVHSPSSLRLGEQCMRAFEHKYVLKHKEPETEDIKWGNQVHKALELRVIERKPMPTGMEKWEWIGKAMDKAQHIGARVRAEHKIGLDRALKPVDFFAKTVWLRMKIDLLVWKGVHAYVKDYKTGKPKDDPTQLTIGALGVFCEMPEIESVQADFVWLSHATRNKTLNYDRATQHWDWQELLPRFKRIEDQVQAGSFEPRPSALCKWCPVKTCEHWKPR